MFGQTDGERRQAVLEKIESAFRHLEFPVFALAAATGVIGEAQSIDGRPVSYSLRFPTPDDMAAIDVATSLVGVDGLPRSSGETLPASEFRSSPSTRPVSPPPVVADGRPLAAAASVGNTRWLVTGQVDDRMVIVSGAGRLPERIELTSVTDAAPYIEAWRRAMGELFG